MTQRIIALLCLALAAASHAAVIQTNSNNTSSETAFPASTTDLINSGQPTFTSASSTGYAAFTNGGFTSDVTTLNDGGLGLPSSNFPDALATLAFDLDGTWTTTFTLNTTSNTYGYDITQINTLAGWQANRADQKFGLSYSTVAAPATYTPLGTFSLDASGVSGSTKIQLTDSTGMVAMNVKNLQFSFQNFGVGTSPETVYREVDVFGTPSTTPPAPTSLSIPPDHASITYSDYAHATVSAATATFDRIIAADTGIGYDNPGTRIRFRTDATTATATLYYNGLHTNGSQNSVGVVLVDGAVASTFTFVSRPGALTIPLLAQGSAAFHNVEIVLPYADSVDFQGLTVNPTAAFQAIAPRPATRYVAYGDSITQGYWASDATKNYPAQIGALRDWTVVNMGFGGRQLTAADGTAVGGLGGSIVTVLMGVNDSIAGKTVAQFKTDYANLIANIRLLQPNVPIYAITPLFTTAPYGGGSLIPLYRTAIGDLVSSLGDPNVRLVDGLALIPGITGANCATWMPDGIHPNDTGFALIAQNLAPLLSIPEPGSAALLALSGLALRRRRK